MNTAQKHIEKNHFAKVGAIDVSSAAFALKRHAVHFSDETSRQTYGGTAHPDSETIYLRMTPVHTMDGVFNSLEVKNCHLSSLSEFSDLLNDVQEFVTGRMARAMLVKLKAGGVIHPHIDQGTYADATDRYHLPLVTNELAWLKSGYQKRHLPVGELWWFDKHTTHEGANEGTTDRVHLIVDFFKVMQ